jgi:hypothetical protein
LTTKLSQIEEIERIQENCVPEKVIDDTIVFANIIDMVSAVVLQMADKEAAQAFNTDGLNKTALGNVIANRIQETFAQ